MYESITNFIQNTDEIWQWLAVGLAAAIPYVESYTAAAIGVIAGINPVIAIVAAIIGNIISMYLIVTFGHSIAKKYSNGKEPTGKAKKLKDALNKYGVVGVSLLGQTLLPSQLTSVALVAFGASKQKVLFWQTISIIIWGVVAGLLAIYGVSVFTSR